MSIEFTDKIDAFVLGQLSTDEHAQFEAEMASNAALAQEVAEAQETYATLAMSLEPVEPSAGVLDRLMEAVSKTNRFEQFIDKIASVLQVGIEKAAEFLSAIDSPGSWELSA